MFKIARPAAVVATVLWLETGCGSNSPHAAPPPTPETVTAPAAASPGPATAAEAEAFMRRVNAEFAKLEIDAERATWVKSTYITDDTEKLESQAQDRLMESLARNIREARRFEGLDLAP